jgi:hypothetical protein
VEINTGRGIVEVTEVTRSGTPVRTARFMANRILALVEYPATDAVVGQQVIDPASKTTRSDQPLDLINSDKVNSDKVNSAQYLRVMTSEAGRLVHALLKDWVNANQSTRSV